MSKKLLVILGAIALLLAAGGAYYVYGGSAGAAALGPDSVQADDHVMGNAKAPVTVIEYFAQDCSVCARFSQSVFPLLKAKYIDTGKVRYVMRLLPISALDPPSYKLDLCMPADKFFDATDLLFRNQPQWDSFEYQGVDAHAGLIRMARIMGMTADQADACMNSKAQDAAINKVAQDGVARYQLNSTPSFVIDFKPVDLPQKSWEEAQAAIDAALAAQASNNKAP